MSTTPDTDNTHDAPDPRLPGEELSVYRQHGDIVFVEKDNPKAWIAAPHREVVDL